MAGRSGARAEKSKLSTATCTAGLHTQAGCGTETVKHTHNPRSGCTNGSRLVLEPTGMLVSPSHVHFAVAMTSIALRSVHGVGAESAPSTMQHNLGSPANFLTRLEFGALCRGRP